MTEDEKLVEKVAEAFQDCGAILTETETYDLARAAIAAVREHDGKGLVHADSTGSERSSDLSAVCFFEGVENGVRCVTHDWVDTTMRFAPGMTATGVCARRLQPMPTVYADCEVEWDEQNRVTRSTHNFSYGPTDDRSAPAASREPDLPSSLTAPHRHMKGGIQG